MLQSQRARAQILITSLNVNVLLATELADVLGEAQNEPPEGAADGTITPEAWEELRSIVEPLEKLIRAVSASRHWRQ